MTIPDHFPEHWKLALAKGDASGFRTEGDMTSFFYKARLSTAIYSEEERNYLDLADRHHGQYEAALARAKAEGRAEFEQSEAAKKAPFKAKEPGAPAPQSKPDVWAGVIERVNAEFNGMARKVYAHRNGKGA